MHGLRFAPRLLPAVIAVAALLALVAAGGFALRETRSPDTTATAGGVCAGLPLRQAPPLPAGANTSSLGSAPAPYALWGPSTGQAPRGVMLLVHGGGWVDTGPGQIGAMAADIERWRAAGFAVAGLDHRPCGASLGDVLATHDLIRARVGPTTPLCVMGQSSGAHLALLLAAERASSVACVIAQAPPADAANLRDQQVAEPTTAATDEAEPRQLADTWRAAFGREWTTRANPVARAPQIVAPTLIAQAAEDPVVPLAQSSALERALRSAHPGAGVARVVLPPGSAYFPHANVHPAALAAYRAQEDAIVAGALAGRPSPPPVVAGWWGG